MVNLLTGQKGSGKTQQMIEAANKKAKECDGNVVFIKNSHNDTYSLSFDIRAICMSDYPSIRNIDMKYTRQVGDSVADPERQYLISTTSDLKTYKRTVVTSEEAADAAFIDKNTSSAKPKFRFCDHAAYIIYRFEVAGMKSCQLTMDVAQNYLIEVSTDGQSWTTAFDYSEGGTVPWLQGANNRTQLSLDLLADGRSASDTVYVKLSNCYPDKGHGGSIYSFVMDYTRAAK